MDSSNIADELILLVRRFHESGTKSLHSLLEETNYSKLKLQVGARDIQEALTAKPECVPEWMQYSEDKRCSSGWYFQKEGTGEFVVGYLTDESIGEPSEYYADALQACAAFIKHEIDNML